MCKSINFRKKRKWRKQQEIQLDFSFLHIFHLCSVFKLFLDAFSLKLVRTLLCTQTHIRLRNLWLNLFLHAENRPPKHTENLHEQKMMQWSPKIDENFEIDKLRRLEPNGERNRTEKNRSHVNNWRLGIAFTLLFAITQQSFHPIPAPSYNNASDIYTEYDCTLSVHRTHHKIQWHAIHFCHCHFYDTHNATSSKWLCVCALAAFLLMLQQHCRNCSFIRFM